MSETRSSLATAERAVVAAAYALEEAQDELCRLDAAAGDGDEGFAMAAAARSIRAEISQRPAIDLAALFNIAATQFSAVGGAMGALSYVLIQAVGDAAGDGTQPLSSADVARLLASAEDAVSAFGSAKRGDKTIVDAIAGARDAAEVGSLRGDSPSQTLLSAAAAAQDATARTADMIARVGRASRLAERSRGTVDAGARSFAIVLDALADTYAAENATRSQSARRTAS